MVVPLADPVTLVLSPLTFRFLMIAARRVEKELLWMGRTT